MVLDPVPFSLAELIEHLRALLVDPARVKGLALHWPRVPWPGKLLGDSRRLQQVLVNLIGNAIKFTPRGDVWWRLAVVQQTRKALTVKFEVVSGIGIQPEAIPGLLEPFTQADSSITRRFGGTGLGLSISHHLVELMGGSLEIRSTPGMGSAFSFTLCLPKAKHNHQNQANGGKRSLDGLHLLLVDDDESTLEFMRTLLEREGAQVHTVTDGGLAFDWLRDHAATCDVVLMDVQMPVMDGITATRLIRNVLELRDLPILAVTAGILPDQQQAALGVGITQLVRKPVDPEALVELLARMPRRGGS